MERHYPQEENSLEQLPNAVLRPAQVINNDRDNIPEISENINARIKFEENVHTTKKCHQR